MIVNALIGDVSKLNTAYSAVAEKYKKNSWSGKKVDQMARAIEAEDLYDIIYRLTSSISHSCPSSIRLYVKSSVPDELIFQLSDDPRLRINILFWATTLAMQVANDFASEAGLGCDAEFDRFLGDLRECVT